LIVGGGAGIAGDVYATTFYGSGAGLTNIPNTALTNSSVTIGTTNVALGGTSSSLTGMYSIAFNNNTTSGILFPYASIGETFSVASLVLGHNIYVNPADTVSDRVRIKVTHASCGYSYYKQLNGIHTWYGLAGSVTADDIITPTTQMILNSTGLTIYGNIIKNGGTSSQFLKADGSIDNNTYLTANQNITLSGDVSGSGTTNITLTLSNSGVSAGTYGNATTIYPITVDGKGRVTSIGSATTISPAWSSITSKPTTLSGLSLTDLTGMATDAPLINGIATVGDSTLAAHANHIHPTDTSRQAALNGTGFVKISGTTISYDNSSYVDLSSDQTNISGAKTFTNTTASTSITTGAVIISGGLGVSGDQYLGGKLNLTAKSATTNLGDIWRDSTQESIATYISGVQQTLSGVIWSKTSTTTLASWTTAATILGASSTGIGTLTLPANFFKVGKTIRLRLKGTLGTASTVPTLIIAVYLGATSVGATNTGTATTLTTASMSNRTWVLDVDITCRTTGSSGTVVAGGVWNLSNSATVDYAWGIGNGSAVTVNTTTSLAIDVKATCGTSNASNTISCTIATIEVLN
jgi:hypothetical protein